MNHLNSILVAVDFSSCSADALRQAARIAQWNQATLRVLHVIELSTFIPTTDPFVPFDMYSEADLVKDASARWKRLVADSKALESVPLDIEIGNARDRILERVRLDQPDLLVMGAESANMAELGLGPTAGACVQRAATKVLLVRKGQIDAFKNIVACIDFSDTSRLALEQAVRMAALDNASLHVLNVYEDPWKGRSLPEPVKSTMPDLKSQYQRAVVSRLRTFCEPLAHELGALKASFHSVELDGSVGWTSPGKGIVSFANREGCDLVMLGTRGKWNLRDYFWGSTAERVARTAHCSVLTIQPEGFTQPMPSTEDEGAQSEEEFAEPGVFRPQL